MATQRFEKLSDEKKLRIINAARDEFARTSYDKVSINKIVKNAGISRGSYYTYFKGKDDLLQRIFVEDNKRCVEIFQESIIAFNGDLWNGMSDWFRRIAVYLKKGAFQKTLQIFSKNDVMKRAVDWLKINDSLIDWLEEHVDKTSLNYPESREQLYTVIKTAHSIAGVGLLNILVHPENDVTKVIKEINTQLELLRYGVENMAN